MSPFTQGFFTGAILTTICFGVVIFGLGKEHRELVIKIQDQKVIIIDGVLYNTKKIDLNEIENLVK